MSAVVDGLFHSNVEVNSQQANDRQDAFNQALVKTLLKVTGHRDLVLDPAIQNAFFPAERYVQSFSYKENPRYTAYLEYQKQILAKAQFLASKDGFASSKDESRSVVADVDTDAQIVDPAIFEPTPLPYLLEVDFASQALEAKMKKNNLPLWGNVRPEVMFWVLIESEGVRKLIGSSKPNIFNDNLFKLSNNYALPVALPLGDELDIQALNMSDLWGLFPDALDQSKLRYASNGNLMLRIYQSMSNTWSANWHFSMNGVSETGFLHNSSMSLINDEIFNFLSSLLAKRFSVVSSEISTNKEITFEVSNINNFKDYVDVQTFLEELSPIKSSSLNWVKGTVMSFSLELNNTPEQLKEYLSLSGKLRFISSDTNEIFLDDNNVQEENTVVDAVEQSGIVSHLVITEKYKWLSSTPETIKK